MLTFLQQLPFTVPIEICGLHSASQYQILLLYYISDQNTMHVYQDPLIPPLFPEMQSVRIETKCKISNLKKMYSNKIVFIVSNCCIGFG
jgi:hypothetical protein